MAYKIFLSPPNLGKKELEYVKDAFNTNWIAPYGPAINAFEQEMAAYIGIDAALALNSGTAALHLALRWFGVTQGDIVFAQTLHLLEVVCQYFTKSVNRCLLTVNQTVGTCLQLHLRKLFNGHNVRIRCQRQ